MKSSRSRYSSLGPLSTVYTPVPPKSCEGKPFEAVYDVLKQENQKQ
jgi:hypothetical protein